MRMRLYYKNVQDKYYKNKKYRKFKEEEFYDYVISICREKGQEVANDQIIITNELGNALANCVGIPQDNTYYFWYFTFVRKLLDGKSYCIDEIKDVILHELAHALTNTIHNKECEHNEKWLETCKLLGYERISFGNKNESNSCITFDVESLPDSTSKNYVLKCSKCNKTLVESKNYNIRMIKAFLYTYAFPGIDIQFSTEINGKVLHNFSDCCHASYVCEFEGEKLLATLEADEEYIPLQNSIRGVLNNELLNKQDLNKIETYNLDNILKKDNSEKKETWR